MKKFLLVTLIGMVLVMNVCGIVKEIIDYYEESNPVEVYKGYTVVHME